VWDMVWKIGGALFVVGAAIAGIAASIYGVKGWSYLSHNDAFRIGIIVAIIGAVLAVVGLVIEFALRDGRLIPEGHRQTLSQTLNGVDGSVQRTEAPNYGDLNGSTRRRDAFREHFSQAKDLLHHLEAYEDATTKIENAKNALAAHLRTRAGELGVVQPPYEIDRIVAFMHTSLKTYARADDMTPITVKWFGYENGHVMPQGMGDLWILVEMREDESEDEWRTRVTEHTDRLDALWSEAQGWAEPEEIARQWKEAVRVRDELTPPLAHAQDVETFTVRRGCPVCRDNRG
jgi:F0F1-type ATP synthase membrane subunit c/vacuolar-type H+-ATPase subunit K